MTTNYTNTFIAVAPDCPVVVAEAPPVTATPTVAALQFELISEHPYEMTSDEILFAVHAIRNSISEAERAVGWERFFAKDQACLRASPLGKRYGWGTHHDADGRVALHGIGTPEYDRLAYRTDITHKAAMRSSRA
ncbi:MULTISPECIES: DUF6157 family protein [unclassified Microbacterium]|uniref:DUF6157 family protein n=1 Tax=unclassified Microbacterium TaxID=2609290 RepID=UPI000EA91A37|nr:MULTISPECIES: DUF6157 family protein [unclassified Microbacterium]MBT2485174.1 hypothetical protein [Microbacterium sp. ISL-108]RKN68008.1 hypothetical protein D7252_10675 [Microbacterium sp. CGR2]